MRIYISGKISGLPYEEVKAKFDKAESDLSARGNDVVSPIKTFIPYNSPRESHMLLDTILLLGCDAVYMLSDWIYSRGATLEKCMAESTGKQIIYEETPVFVELKQAVSETIGIPFYEIAGSSRKRDIVYARMIYVDCCLKRGASVTSIAAEMKHNHSTVLYYLRKFNDDYTFNPKFRDIANRIESSFQNK